MIHPKNKIRNARTNHKRIEHSKYGVNKDQRNEKVTSGQSENRKLNTESTGMDRENFCHWGARREIRKIIRRRNNSSETRRLIKQRNEPSRPGTLRRLYGHYSQRTVFAPSRPNKRSREEIAEIDAEIMRRANRLGGGYQPKVEEQEEPEELRDEGELEIETVETDEDSVIMRGDNLPIVDLSKYNTEKKEEHYIQINHIVGKLTSNKKITEDHIKKPSLSS